VRLIYFLVEDCGELDRAALEDATGWSEDTVRRALNDLEAGGLIERLPAPDRPQADRVQLADRE